LKQHYEDKIRLCAFDAAVCSDDVSQIINDENGYCELQVKFDKDTNKLEITL
jgi:hypothetical protein